MKSRRDLALIVGLALLHGLLYVWLIPPWQIPDEPSQFEYAALFVALGRVPRAGDTDPVLDRRLAESLLRARFYERLTGATPEPPPATMEQARAAFFMPSQLGADPPLYFGLAALVIGGLAGQPIEAQLLGVRLLGVLWLAGAALCAYCAARELAGDARGPALAAGLLVALQPMFVFIGVGAGDDGLANLLGAALCWALVRAARHGLSPARLALLLGLALLGWQTKRTFTPWLLLLLLAGAWLALRGIARLRRGWWARVGLLLALLAAPLALLAAGLAAGRDPAVAREWYESTAAMLAPRVLAAPLSGRPALALRAGQNAIQGVPPVAMEWAQNQQIELRTRVWAPAGARGKLVIDFGWATVEQPFTAGGEPQLVRVQMFLPLYCPALAVGISAEQGALYADRLALTSARDPGVALIENGDLAEPGYRDGALQERLVPALRLRELAWGWRSGWLLGPPPLGWGLARIFFASFWGQFGWMSLPVVADTLWEPALALLCAGGLAGALLAALRPGEPAWRRRALALLLGGLALGLLAPLLNAYTQPRGQAIQQGRYLFAMLAPLALLLAWGWRAWLPARWRAAGLALWAAGWLAFAGAAIVRLLAVYRPDVLG